MTACHEAGHAVALALTEGTEPLHKVTIIPRGQSLGSTIQLPEKDKYTEGRKQLLGMIVGAMGGRAAEKICFGEITTGAASDIKSATHIARLMVTEWGMSDELGPQCFGARDEILFLGRELSRTNEISEETARKIDSEVKKIIDESYAKALDILSKNRAKLDLLTNILIERESLDGRDVDNLLKHGRILSAAERNAEDAAKDAAAQDVKPTEPPPAPAAPPAA
jgi:cell division protease FtsH